MCYSCIGCGKCKTLQQGIALVRCPHCGKMAENDALRCPSCGAPLSSNDDETLAQNPVAKQ